MGVWDVEGEEGPAAPSTGPRSPPASPQLAKESERLQAMMTLSPGKLHPDSYFREAWRYMCYFKLRRLERIY